MLLTFLVPVQHSMWFAALGTGTSGSVGGSLEQPVSLRPMVRMSPSGSTAAAAPTLVWQPVKGIRGDRARRPLHLCCHSPQRLQCPIASSCQRQSRSWCCRCENFASITCVVLAGKEPVPWHVAVVQLDMLAYVRRHSSTAEAAVDVLQPGIRNQLQVWPCCMLWCGCRWWHGSCHRLTFAVPAAQI